MTLDEIKAAVMAGKKVHVGSMAYRVEYWAKNDEFFIVCVNGHAIGLTHRNGVTINARPDEFFVA